MGDLSTVSLAIPMWGLLVSTGGFIATAVTVIVGVMVSNRDLKTTTRGLDRTTQELARQVGQLNETVGALTGLREMMARETERGDATHKALFDRIERIEKQVFALMPAPKVSP